MRRLRQKLETDANHPRHLITVRGIGYRLVSTGAIVAVPDHDP
jgi:DNA-binding response OmpR family regulator